MLGDNTWGYAIPGQSGFNKNYSEAPDDQSKWAALAPLGEASINVADAMTSTPSEGSTHEIWFGVRLGSDAAAGDYKKEVVYTATADLPAIPTVTAVSPDVYNLGNDSSRLQITLTGTSFKTVSDVWIDLDKSGAENHSDNEKCLSISIKSDTELTCTLPTDTSIASGSYAIWVSNQAGSGNSSEIFTYKKTPEILSMSPVRYNLYGDKPVSMVGGEHHSLLLTSSGSLFGWGSNDKGQVGNGSTETVNEPMNITGLLKLTDGEHIIQVGTLGYHSLALTNTGRVFSWGDNENGEVGNGGTAVVVTPTDITANFDLDDGDQITQLVVGWKQSFVLTKLGKIYAWGSNEYGQLGFGDNVTRRKPEQLSYAFDGAVIAMATDSHTVAVTDKGRVYSWGFNGSGQLGNGSTSNSSTPVDITSRFGGAKITKVWAGSNNSFALSDGGVLYAWGNNEMGELGISRGTFGNSNATKNVPTALASNAFGNSAVVQFSAGYHFSIAKTQSGKVYVWGDNDNGELGMGKPSGWNIKKYKDTPTELSAGGLDASTITEVSATGNSLFALTNKGEIYYWGDGSTPSSISSKIDYSDVALYGVNINDTSRVFVDIQVNGNYDGDAELCKDLYISTDRTIVNCRIPSDRSIALGSYDVYVELKDGTKLKSPSRLEYYNDASW